MKVPNSNHVTEIVCDRFCGILEVDAKYVNVKGYDKGAAFIYAIDYLSHDIVLNMLAPSENYQAYLAFFHKLKLMNYPLQFLVCDGLEYIVTCARFYFPNLKIQLCLNHIKEGLRRLLKVRSDNTHKSFFTQIAYAFELDHHYSDYRSYIRKLLKRHSYDPLYKSILADIVKRNELLSTHARFKQCPKTNNLIESFNSHLECRLKSLKGFQSLNTAELWLNAYVMNRRLTPFTDCTGKFKQLNGSTSISHTAINPKVKLSLLKKF